MHQRGRAMTLDDSLQLVPSACAGQGADTSELDPQPTGTPVQRVRLSLGEKLRNVYLKLEGANAGGSIKDRTARSLLQSLENRGRLMPGGRLVESSSGNLAVSLARLARERDYQFTAVVDPKITAENMQRLRGYGAQTVMVETPDSAGGYLQTRLDCIRKMLAEDPQLLWPDQYSNEANPDAHYSGTAPELFRQMEQRVDAVFVAVSTGGTLAGIGRYFRQVSPDTRIIAVDAAGSIALGGEPAERKLNGIGSSRRASFINPGLYDELMYVGDCEAFAFCRAVELATGLKLGGSGGACLAASARYLQLNQAVSRAVCICPDRGEHYLSSIYSDEWLAQNGIALDPLHLGPVSDICL